MIGHRKRVLHVFPRLLQVGTHEKLSINGLQLVSGQNSVLEDYEQELREEGISLRQLSRLEHGLQYCMDCSFI